MPVRGATWLGEVLQLLQPRAYTCDCKFARNKSEFRHFCVALPCALTNFGFIWRRESCSSTLPSDYVIDEWP